MDEALALIDALSPIHLAYVDKFQAEQRLGSRAEALRLLLDIAIETVNDTGDRFWDSRPREPDEVPRRRPGGLAGGATPGRTGR